MAYHTTRPGIIKTDTPLPCLDPCQVFPEPNGGVVCVLADSMYRPSPGSVGGEEDTEGVDVVEQVRGWAARMIPVNSRPQ